MVQDELDLLQVKTVISTNNSKILNISSRDQNLLHKYKTHIFTQCGDLATTNCDDIMTTALWWGLEVMAIMKVSRWIWQNKDSALLGKHVHI